MVRSWSRSETGFLHGCGYFFMSEFLESVGDDHFWSFKVVGGKCGGRSIWVKEDVTETGTLSLETFLAVYISYFLLRGGTSHAYQSFPNGLLGCALQWVLPVFPFRFAD